MKANTLKIEDPLLGQLYAAKPATQALSAFARELLHYALQQRQLRAAGMQYRHLLDVQSKLADEERDWAEAPLTTAPRVRRQRAPLRRRQT